MLLVAVYRAGTADVPAEQFSTSLFHFGQNLPDELPALIKLLVPARLIFHGIKERLLQRACKVSVPPKGAGTNKNQQSGCWIGACFCGESLLGRSTCLCLSPVLLTFAAITA